LNTPENKTSRFGDTAFVAGLAIVSILIPAFLIKIYWFSGFKPSSLLQIIAGSIIAVIVIALFSFNIHTSFLRPWMHQRKNGSLDDYHFVSGAPGLGSILVPIVAILLPNYSWIGIILLALYLLDTGGIHIAAFTFIWDCLSTKKEA
jgi:hypothetical protein